MSTRPNNALAVAYPWQPITPARRAAFLACLEKCGTINGAARALAQAEGRDSNCNSTWHALRRRDVTFAAECEAALQRFVDGLHERARQLAMGELTRAVRFQGAVVGYEQIVEPNVLLRLLERHDRNWAQHRKFEHVVHTDAGGDVGITIALSEVEQLPREDREALMRICVSLRAIRAQAIEDAKPEPALLGRDDEIEPLDAETAAELEALR
jgi:hypothetical protein